MNKELDYQLAPVMSLYKPKISTAKDVKVACVRVASSTVSFTSFLSTVGTKRKVLTEAEVIKAINKIGLPGLKEATEQFVKEDMKTTVVPSAENSAQDQPDLQQEQ
ncbi:Conserved_hypothetical protein [Hexamita inflata]|uniref:Uncharacterized protein n=1 Tax=Hexamita inflata TaxID=28002 RepID=A0AA86R0C4_9EUKA|nr:Conserved hypothetical protein [Hexamita inflata]